MSFFAAAKRERVAAGVLVGLAIVFVGVALLQRMHRGDADVLLPLALLAADLTVAAALLSGWYSVRPVAQGLAIFGALAHVLLLLGGRPELIRVTSGLLAAAHVYCLVLLFQLGAGYDYEDDEHNAVEDVPAPVAEVPPTDAASVPVISEPTSNPAIESLAAETPDVELAEPEAEPEPESEPEREPEPESEPAPESEPEPEPESKPEPEPSDEQSEITVEEQAESTEPHAVEPEPAGEVPTAPPEAGQNESDQDQPARDQAVPVTTTVGAEQAPVSEERAT